MTGSGFDPARVASLRRALQRAPGQLYGNLRETLHDQGARWEGKMLNRVRNGQPLRRRTGDLARSINQKVSGSSLADLQLRAVSTSRYAKVQEFGTVGKGGALPDIRPTRGKFLTIPIADNLTPTKKVRFGSAAALRATGKTFVLAFGAHRYIVLRDGEKLKFLWMLARKVSLPPRLGFFATWAEDADTRRGEMSKAVEKSLKEAFG